MTCEQFLQPAPPWAAPADWQAANQSMAVHVHRYREQLRPAAVLARRVRRLLATIFPLLDEICRLTCSRCPDPCCLAASPWYDFRDLVFLHLNGLTPLQAQPVASLAATCRYIGPRGCTLPRMVRPWICTWYVCPVQSRRLRNTDRCRWQSLNRILNEIKQDRRQMEDAFIQAICGLPYAAGRMGASHG